MISSRLTSFALALMVGMPSVAVFANTVDKVLQQANQKTAAAQASQKKIDTFADKTQSKLQEYKQELKVVEDLKVYNKKLELQVNKQLLRQQQIEKSIKDVAVIQRQITPLLLRMIDSLEQFVKLDVPFHQQERSERIAFLRKSMDRSDLTAAEKFRQVLEAYKIENEYGRKIDSYKDTIDIDGNKREVNMLRVGRVALLYQTTDEALSGRWDKEQGKFVALDNNEYRKAIKQGIKMAKKQASIDLLDIPVSAPEVM